MKNRTAVKFLWPYFIAHKYKLAMAAAGIVGVICSMWFLGAAVSYIINSIAIKNISYGNSALLLGCFLLLFIGGSVARSVAMNDMALLIKNSIWQDSYLSLFLRSPFFFHHFPKENIVSRINADIAIISKFISGPLSYSVRNFLMTIFGICMLCVVDFKMFMVVLVLVFIQFTVLSLLLRMGSGLNKALLQEGDRLSSLVFELINYSTIVKIYNNEESEKSSVMAIISNMITLGRRVNIRRTVIFIAMVCFSVFIVGVVILIGARSVIVGTMSAGDLTAFLFYAFVVASSFVGLADLHGDLNALFNSCFRTAEIFTSNLDSIAPQENLLEIEKIELIEFNNITFSYPERPSQIVLKNFSCTISIGDKVAIVGDSGSGKSAMIDLLLGLYWPNCGSIKVNGSDIRQIKKSSLYSQIAYVAQDSTIFTRSILDNAAYGPHTNHEIAKDLLVQFGLSVLDSNNSQMSNSYSGSMGKELSAGESQRICNVRALSKRSASLLIFDEALSALDLENRTVVMRKINSSADGKILLFITHHLDEVGRHFNKIINLSAKNQ